jgi:dihydroorotase
MFELAEMGQITKEKVVEKMSHAPAELFQIDRRGYLKPGYYADLVLLESNQWTVDKGNILYHCNWSPLEGQTFKHRVTHTFVNGQLAYQNGQILDKVETLPLEFNR